MRHAEIGPDDHCFVIPAHGVSEHLESCLESLLAQTVRSRVLIATSTPNDHIRRLAERHGIPVHANPEQGGIGADWNFALDAANATWITLAHQDDVYLEDFTQRTLHALSRHPDALMAFCSYGEIEETLERPVSTLIRLKNVLLELGFLGSASASSPFFKTNALRFGCAIPCPSVTLRKETRLRFRTDLKVDLDWAAWLSLAKRPGSFVYVREKLMMHRVHRDSETSSAISSGSRLAEDASMLRSLWPGFIAKAIVSSYRIAYRSNRSRT